jgi:hypothetical protein
MDEKYIEIGKTIFNALKNLKKKESIQIYRHLPDLKIECHFSKDKKYRYCLCAETNKIKKGKTVCVIMQNPSYANEYIADKSVNFLEKALFEYKVHELNVKKMIVVNLFAEIQTDNFTPSNSPEEGKNINFIEKAVEESDVVIIGWGKMKKFTTERKAVVDILANYSGTVYKTKKHPSLHPKLIEMSNNNMNLYDFFIKCKKGGQNASLLLTDNY